MAEITREPVRPDKLQSFIGQSKLKSVLNISIQGAKARREPMGHTVFIGPPGLGKTTLANIIAFETGLRLIVANGPSITKVGSLATLLNGLDGQSCVLFIDEIHRISKTVEEVLYPVMEDFRLDITSEKMHINVQLPRFTLVGATTRYGLLTKPLRDRFPHQFHLDFYSLPEMEAIIKRSAGIMKIEIEDRAVEELARRSKRTPRIANNLLSQTRDFALAMNIPFVSYPVVLGMMDALEIDDKGLGRVDRLILENIVTRFKGGPVGVDTLAATMVEEPDVLAKVYEPFLVQEGYLILTPRGRVASKAAYEHLKRPAPITKQEIF